MSQNNNGIISEDGLKHNHYATQIQQIYRGLNCRNKRLPTVLYAVKRYLIDNDFSYCKSNDDGRTNSCLDEKTIINLLRNMMGMHNRIYVPKKRSWYDVSIKDYMYGWLPVNIKTTTTRTSDNVGNLSICVQAYINTELNLEKSYNNGELSEILFKELNNKNYNRKKKKDYYFLVCNKNKKSEIIVNSVKGLTKLTPNLNNLPFQVCWHKNKRFEYKPIEVSINDFIRVVQKPKLPWQQRFLKNLKELKQIK